MFLKKDEEDRGATRLMVGALMDYQEKEVKDITGATGLAYNTVLSYKRGQSDRVNLRVIDEIAGELGVDGWQLFYRGQLVRPLVKLAQALGVVLENPDFTDYPVTKADYVQLLQGVAEKVGVELTEEDFMPLD